MVQMGYLMLGKLKHDVISEASQNSDLFLTDGTCQSHVMIRDHTAYNHIAMDLKTYFVLSLVMSLNALQSRHLKSQ